MITDSLSKAEILNSQFKLPVRLLQCLAKEITPIVHYIFTQSLCTDELPTEWAVKANVAHIIKKGSKLPSCISDMQAI